MELSNDFRVNMDRDATWKVLTDLERIAPLLPGAQLQEVEGDEYRGIVKVKVGPISAQYKGKATLVETDEGAGKMVMKASGRDTRGQGNASATITITMTPDGDGTKVNASTDLTISGKVAQFGRGALADVSSKLIGQFVDNLEKDIMSGGKAAAGEAAPSAPDPSAGGATPTSTDAVPDETPEEALVGGDEVAKAETNGSAGPSATASGDVGPGTTAPSASGTAPTGAGTSAGPSSAGSAPAKPASSGPRKIDSPDPEPVDLFDAAGSTVIKKVVPAVGAVAVLAIVFVVLRRRRRASRAQRTVAAFSSTLSDVRGRLPDVDTVADLGRKAAKQSRKAAKDAAKQSRKAASKAADKAAKQSRKAAKKAAKRGEVVVEAAQQGRKAAKKAAERGRALAR